MSVDIVWLPSVRRRLTAFGGDVAPDQATPFVKGQRRCGGLELAGHDLAYACRARLNLAVATEGHVPQAGEGGSTGQVRWDIVPGRSSR